MLVVLVCSMCGLSDSVVNLCVWVVFFLLGDSLFLGLISSVMVVVGGVLGSDVNGMFVCGDSSSCSLLLVGVVGSVLSYVLKLMIGVMLGMWLWLYCLYDVCMMLC